MLIKKIPKYSAAVLLVLSALTYISMPVFSQECPTWVNPPNCNVINVSASLANCTGGAVYPTISAGVLASTTTSPNIIDTNSCVVIRDTQTYNEQVTVQNFTFTYSTNTLTIMADPTFVSSAPVVNPPTASTAAFQIMNTSVTIQNINVYPTNSVPYGVLASSPNAILSNILVIDNASAIGQAGIVISGFDSVFNSTISVTVLLSTGMLVNGTQNEIMNSYIASLEGMGTLLEAASNNTISQSTITIPDFVSVDALTLESASSNTITGSYLTSVAGAGATFRNANNNTISQSTITSGSGPAWFATSSSSNTMIGSYLYAPNGGALLQTASNNNTISQSILAGSTAITLEILSSSSNTITRDKIYSNLGEGIFLQSVNNNTISHSTITSNSYIAFYLESSSSNTVMCSNIQGSTAVYISNSAGTVISGNTLTANSAQGGSGLYMDSSVNLNIALLSDTISGGASASGIYLDAGDNITIASDTISGAAYGLQITTQPGAVLAVSSLTFAGLTPGATAIYFLNGPIISTFSSVDFADTNIAVNVNAAALNPPSQIIMQGSLGPLAGTAYDIDPNQVVSWTSGSGGSCPTWNNPAACLIVKNVYKAGSCGAASTITSALDSLPPTLSGNACIVIRDTQTYSEQVTVQNFTFTYSTSTLTIMADPTFMSSAPVINPPMASTSAFQIMNTSVTIQNIVIMPTNTISYGIESSSFNLTLTTVTVADASGLITQAAVTLNSFSAVNTSRLIALNAAADGLVVNGAANTVTQSYMAGGTVGADLEGNNNTITLSTLTSNAGSNGLYINDSSNTVTQSYMFGGATGVTINSGSSNTISMDIIVATESVAALDNFGIANIITQDLIIGGGNSDAVDFEPVSALNILTLSTMTSANNNGFTDFGSANMVKNSYMSGGNFGAEFSASTSSIIGLSTIFSDDESLYINGVTGFSMSSNTILGVSQSAGIYISTGNTGTIYLTSTSIQGASYGLEISTQLSKTLFSLSISSLTFSSLTPGATAIYFLGGPLISTFSSVNFADTSIGLNINASALNSPSQITMQNPLGPRVGPAYDIDPNGVVAWPSSFSPPSITITPSSQHYFNALPSLAGTAGTTSPTTIASVSVAIQNQSTGKYWGGSAFSSTSLVFYATAAISAQSPGIAFWNFYSSNTADSPTAANLTSGVSYSYFIQAQDSNAQNSSAGSFIIDYDTVPPAAVITSTGLSGNTFTILGVSTSTYGVPVSTISLSFQDINIPGPNNCYDGVADFDAVCPSTFSAQGSSTSWSYSTSSLQPGTTFVVLAQAVDIAGNVESSFTLNISSETLYIPSSPPNIVINSPQPNSPNYFNALPPLIGTAMANFSGGSISSVSISIQNLSSGKYWNGSSFSASSLVFYTTAPITSYGGGGLAFWNFYSTNTANSPTASSLMSGTSYFFLVQSKDSLNQTSLINAPSISTYTVNYDTVPPIAVITSTGLSGNIFTISGTTTSAYNVAVSTVILSFQDQNIAAPNCYNIGTGNFNAVCPSTFPALGTPTGWSYSTNSLQLGTTFVVFAQAADIAGNVQSTFTVSISSETLYIPSPPPQTYINIPSVSGPDYFNVLPGLVGTAMAEFSGGSISSVSISIQNLSTGKYWNGLAFNSTNLLFYSTAPITGYAGGALAFWNFYSTNTANSPTASNLTSGTSYFILVQSRDSLNQTSLFNAPSVSTYTVNYDTVPPVASITSAGFIGSTYTLLGTSSSTYSVPLSTVVLSLQDLNIPGPNNCYDGVANFDAVCPSNIPALGTPTSWSYPINSLQQGTTFVVLVQATDIAGNVQNSFLVGTSSETLYVPSPPPDVFITVPQPASPNYFNALPALIGTAFANFVGGSISSVSVSIQNLSSGKYWNGSAFNSTNLLFYSTASITSYSGSLASWNFYSTNTANSPAASTLNSGTSYFFLVQSKDSLNQTSLINAPNISTYTVNYDTVPPAAVITNSNITGNTFTIAGTTASLYNVPVSTVMLSLQDQNIAAPNCYNTTSGNFNATCPAYFPAQGSVGAWTYFTTLQSGTTFVALAQATDIAGNVQSAFTINTSSRTFYIPSSPPSVTITLPNLNYFNAAPSIVGTALATNPASISSVSIAIQNLSSGLYWNGAAFSASNTVLFPSATITAVNFGVNQWTFTPAVSLTASLTSGTSYSYFIQAKDSLNQSSLSNAANSTTTFNFNYDNIPPTAIITSTGVSGNTFTISGTVTSPNNVPISTVSLSFEDINIAGPNNCYDTINGNFDKPCPADFPASGTAASWSYSTNSLQSGAAIVVLAQGTDVAGNVQNSFSAGISSETLYITISASGNGPAAFIAPSSITGCQVLVTTITFKTGSNGLATGGLIALHIPNGWSPPLGEDSINDPPAQAGYIHVGAAAGSYGLQFNPSQVGSAILGNNWIVFTASSTIAANASINFIYTTYPASGAQAQGQQVFSIQSQPAAGGNLAPIQGSPFITQVPGPAANLNFTSYNTLVLGPLQNSPTMQITLTDTCNISTTAATLTTISLGGQISNGPSGPVFDNTVNFFAANGSALPFSQVVILAGASLSSGFMYNTNAAAAAGIGSENVVASGTLNGNSFPTYAYRYVQLLAAPISVNSVSVDTGTLGTSTNATLTPNSANGGTAVINFTLSNANLGWEVVISTDPNFGSKVVDDFGNGNPGRTIVWNGYNQLINPPQFVPSGTYYVEIIAGGGAATNKSLTITVAPTASIFGEISNGPGVNVSASGGSAGVGNYAIASSTGYFQIIGLQPNAAYDIQASSSILLSGQPLYFSTNAYNVVALLSGANIGTLTLPTLGVIQIAAVLPSSAPVDISGNVSVHNADYSQSNGGPLHFSSGSTTSDNGAATFGGVVSTWTSFGLPPGVYEADISIPIVNISTQIMGIVLGNTGAVVQESVTLVKKANVYGNAILPTAPISGAGISVQATQLGNTTPTIFGSVGLLPATSSGVYSLFGLAPGSWTITAQSQGYIGVSSSVLIVGTSDVGNPTTGGFDLTLQKGGVIAGTITINGSTSQLTAAQTCTVPPTGIAAPTTGLCVTVNAYSPAAFFGSSVQLNLATSTLPTSSTFTISGLPNAVYSVNNTNLQGFINASQNVTVSSGTGSANLVLTSAQTNMAVSIILPKGHSDFNHVSLGIAGTQGFSLALPDITAGSIIQYFVSSATLQFPALNPDLYQFQAYYAPSGVIQRNSAALSNNSSSAVTLDLSGSTYSLSGTIALSGSINIPTGGGFSVAASSVPGFLSNISALSYCVLGSSPAISLSAAHMELLPVGPNNSGFFSGALPSPANASQYILQQQGGTPTPPTGFCPSGMINGEFNNGPGNGPNPFLIYVSSIASNGSFSFPNVPPGLYELRNNSQVDLNNDQIAQYTQVINVTGTVSGLSFQLANGASISGNILAPVQTSLNRPILLSLMNSQGRQTASTVANFSNSNTASFVFSQLPNDNYTIITQDTVYPKAYAATPLSVQLSGQNVTGESIQLVPSGTIKAQVAVQENLANGAQQFLLINQSNAALLPNAFQIQAQADPWFEGGLMSAENSSVINATANSGPSNSPGVDSNGNFVIDGLLPGTYDVQFNINNGPSANSLGLVGSTLSGVTVTGGNVTQIGPANLLVGAQITGQVASQNNTPLANIALSAQPSQRAAGISSQNISATTDANGHFALNGLSPTVRYYDITAAARGVNGNNEQQGEVLPPYEQVIDPSVDITSVTILNYSLFWATYTISGQVVAPAGGPALGSPFNGNSGGAVQPGAAVFLQQVGVIPTKTPLGDIQFDTDINGNFTIPSLTTGTYRMTIVSLGYSSFQENVTIATNSPNVGIITLTQGATLSGSITQPDGSSPSTNEINTLVAVTPDLANVLVGNLNSDPNALTVTGYSVAGFKTGLTYELLLIGSNNTMVAPQGATNIVFTSTASQTLNVTYMPSPPLALAKVFQQNSVFQLEFDMSQPLRDETAADNDLSLILTTVSAQGTLSQLTLSQDRATLTAIYTPGVSESSFTLHLHAYSNQTNPASLDPVNPQFVVDSTNTFFTGISAVGQSNISNFNGGNVIVQGDAGRITMPAGAFSVAASSTVQVTLQLADEPLNTTNPSEIAAAGARLSTLRRSPASYPSEIVAAVAAVPPALNPFSAFYNIFLPLGISTALSKPVQLTVAYSTGTDPSTLNIYWYNPLANEYVLQQDVTGAPPVINSVDDTITININHFSTYVLFQSGEAVITGATGATSFGAYNFPNPFSLSAKTVTVLHPGTGSCDPSCTINGTMIELSLSPSMSGDGTLNIFNVAGTKVRSIDLGSLQGGDYYYQNWDGANNSGRAVASGVYIGEVKVGGQTTFFKMALIKGSGQ